MKNEAEDTARPSAGTARLGRGSFKTKMVYFLNRTRWSKDGVATLAHPRVKTHSGRDRSHAGQTSIFQGFGKGLAGLSVTEVCACK
jgi:hypothetical protein